MHNSKIFLIVQSHIPLASLICVVFVIKLAYCYRTTDRFLLFRLGKYMNRNFYKQKKTNIYFW